MEPARPRATDVTRSALLLPLQKTTLDLMRAERQRYEMIQAAALAKKTAGAGRRTVACTRRTGGGYAPGSPSKARSLRIAVPGAVGVADERPAGGKRATLAVAPRKRVSMAAISPRIESPRTGSR